MSVFENGKLRVTSLGGALLSLVVAARVPVGCRDERHPGASPGAAKPVPRQRATPAPTASPGPDAPGAALHPPPPLDLPLSEDVSIRKGWITIEEKADAAQRAWVEGSVVGDDKIVINTRNVRRYQLDLSRLRLNWDKRVVLRIDGFNSELTRKRWPVLRLARTASGAWTVVDEK